MRNLREAIRQKRPDLWKNKNWLLHHDNAPAHTSLLVRDLLAKNNTLMMPQPPYSPDLAPSAGGGSAINTMFYTRGNRKDFDTWVEKSGATGWGWDDVLPYFVSLEDYLEYQDPDDPIYGTLGETALSYAVDGAYTEKSRSFLDAGTNATIPSVDNGEVHIGKTVEIIFNNKKAVGVEFDINANSLVPFLRVPCKAYARKEVLLSAGTFGSAQLLMLSGVGPKEELDKHGIEKQSGALGLPEARESITLLDERYLHVPLKPNACRNGNLMLHMTGTEQEGQAPVLSSQENNSL
ncbi:hypothetical protein LAZ67_8002094 [Cordylochernes scorpioides]|uniref:Glucose-methanol-choline oxidoreductase N-terminal domain-containing protein n=1 Tax=Cordylochernes scorpioides TaxID=51811 RepID=A0ABY6KQR6_9ARAC|nr:hypothetical protein LAZ67_8002094 [Cordylochernes scorpioides]